MLKKYLIIFIVLLRLTLTIYFKNYCDVLKAMFFDTVF